jgi:hypothetical protein
VSNLWGRRAHIMAVAVVRRLLVANGVMLRSYPRADA